VISQRRSSRLAPLAVVLALLVTLMPTPVPAHASVDGGAEAQFVAQLNQARQAAGLPTVRVAGDLTAVARRHSERMAGQSNLHHNPNLGSDVSGWQKVGENVGRGPSVGAIHTAFMDSPGHRANILGGDWVEVGVGVVVRDGQLWVTEVFRLPASSAPAPSPEPEPTTSASAPASEAESGDAPAQDRPAADAPEPTASPEPEPEPEPAPRVTPPGPRHEVSAPPLPLDRTRLTLARLEAAETAVASD
jgi:hypothetical protein